MEYMNPLDEGDKALPFKWTRWSTDDEVDALLEIQADPKSANSPW